MQHAILRFEDTEDTVDMRKEVYGMGWNDHFVYMGSGYVADLYAFIMRKYQIAQNAHGMKKYIKRASIVICIILGR